jgi:hypothetical protein
MELDMCTNPNLAANERLHIDCWKLPLPPFHRNDADLSKINPIHVRHVLCALAYHDGKGFTTDLISNWVGLSTTTVRECCNALFDFGLLRKVDSGDTWASLFAVDREKVGKMVNSRVTVKGVHELGGVK